MNNNENILASTESICPTCLRRIPAVYEKIDSKITLNKTCPIHGLYKTVVWRGEPCFYSWTNAKTPAKISVPLTQVDQGCPFDCGLCIDHRQHTCTALIEVTQRCNLACQFCFADANGKREYDPDLSAVERLFRTLKKTYADCNVQLSGGEPTLRDDLPEIISLGKKLGFKFIQVNTNGLRIAKDVVYLDRLKNAGLASIFLQFDGTEGNIYQTLRGRNILEDKIAAIERCADLNVGIILVPTLVPGVNTHNIGSMIEFALRYAPAVRGIHFQPISYFGRYPHSPENSDRITIPEIIRAIVEQTGDLINLECFKPSGCENALCSFHANFIIMPGDKLFALTKHKTEGCCQVNSAEKGAIHSREFVARNWTSSGEDEGTNPVQPGQSLGEWDLLVERARTHLFTISGMAFQDIWNLDLNRLHDCCIHVVSPDARLIPFCAYNLTDQSGQSLYRKNIPSSIRENG